MDPRKTVSVLVLLNVFLLQINLFQSALCLGWEWGNYILPSLLLPSRFSNVLWGTRGRLKQKKEAGTCFSFFLALLDIPKHLRTDRLCSQLQLLKSLCVCLKASTELQPSGTCRMSLCKQLYSNHITPFLLSSHIWVIPFPLIGFQNLCYQFLVLSTLL